MVNDHCFWLRDIFQCGVTWNQRDRMNYNITDNAENVAHLRLLIKDHKGWTEDSGRPPPSRPVCAGNDGGNRHISEIVSLILEPVACESNGNDIDSTGDMLSKIKKLNEDISKKLNKENMVGS